MSGLEMKLFSLVLFFCAPFQICLELDVISSRRSKLEVS
jgi:hypothetical protein